MYISLGGIMAILSFNLYNYAVSLRCIYEVVEIDRKIV